MRENEIICKLNQLLSQSIPLWVLEKVINRRIDNAHDEKVKKELEDLLEELR